MRVLGLDEAGRGCVLGPLCVGGFLVDGDLAALVATGATDSKALSARKRERIRAQLDAVGTPWLAEIEPEAIDQGNLNALEERSFVEAILALGPDEVFLDAPVHPGGIPALVRRLRAACPSVKRWVVEPKADANYPVVGAASIVAKVARDARIAALGDVGSGYPSDPVTRELLSGFIRRGEAFPRWVRTRWATIDNLRQEVLAVTSAVG